MNSLTLDKVDTSATEVECTDNLLIVYLAAGRVISVPIEWFPRLRDATHQQRSNWRLIGEGIGIHWEDVDEDISVDGLLTHS